MEDLSKPLKIVVEEEFNKSKYVTLIKKKEAE